MVLVTLFNGFPLVLRPFGMLPAHLVKGTGNNGGVVQATFTAGDQVCVY
jgi:hypothetical protein